MHFAKKYDDISETLVSQATAVAIALAILSLAPMVIAMAASN